MLGAVDFAGRWRIERRIDDRLSGQGGRFDGEALLAPAGPGRLTWAERGLLRLGHGPAVEARRDYIWWFDDSGIAVLFSDERPFHRFVPQGRAAGTDHPCGADLYRVTYDFTAWPVWSARWEVSGPRKDYTMDSRMTPA